MTELTRLYCCHDLWALDNLLDLTTGQMLTCYSAHSLSAQDRWDGGGGVGGGDRMESLGGTTDRPSLPTSWTNNVPHASRVRPISDSDGSSPALRPPTTTGRAAPPPPRSHRAEPMTRWGLNRSHTHCWESLSLDNVMILYIYGTNNCWKICPDKSGEGTGEDFISEFPF